MNSRTLSFLAIGVFLILGSVFIALRYHGIKAARTAREDSLWRLSYDVFFETTSPNDEVRIAWPMETRYCRVVNEVETAGVLKSQGHGPYKSTGFQEWWVSARQPDKYNFRASFDLRLSPRANMSRVPPLESLSPDYRLRYLDEDGGVIPTNTKEVLDLAQTIPDEGTDAQRVQWIFDHCAGIDGSGQLDTVKEALETGKGSPLAKARAMVALCRSIRIPARLVVGFEIKQGVNLKPHVWAEVFQRQSWIPFDPENGYSYAMPMQFVPVRRDSHEIVRGIGAEISPETTYSVQRIEPPVSVLQSEERHPIQILRLTNLPVPMHKVIKILLLLPFAALITSVMRNVVGIGTFGTFAPALLAMSFIYADWETGLAILIVVVTAGLISRTFLDRLRLLMVPRLSITLTIVILCVVLGVSLLDYIELTPGAQAVLLPMIILTMLIERFYVTTEEDGLLYTIKMAAGTLLVATLCYLMLGWNRIGELVLVYPEAHFFTIALFIFLGRYAGYRLTELWRFRELVIPTETPS